MTGRMKGAPVRCLTIAALIATECQNNWLCFRVHASNDILVTNRHKNDSIFNDNCHLNNCFWACERLLDRGNGVHGRTSRESDRTHVSNSPQSSQRVPEPSLKPIFKEPTHPSPQNPFDVDSSHSTTPIKPSNGKVLPNPLCVNVS